MRLIELMMGDEALLDMDVIDGELEIAGLTCDSRAVRPGFLFAALPGAKVDGRDYIQSAQSNGAVAVLAPVGTRADLPVIEDANVRQRFARMAANFYARQPETIAAVTGTNGKTSTASFLRQIWEHVGFKAASLGTLGVHGGGFDEPGKLTTPDPVALHDTLARLKDAGIEHAAMEASSHGLEQFRLDGVKIKAAGFTNITRDHLDYHGTMEAYLDAKLRLFTEVLEQDGTAVVNADSNAAHTVIDAAQKRGVKVLGYGRAGEDIRVIERLAHDRGQTLSLSINGLSHTVELPLIGAFQAENALCALGLAMALGVSAPDGMAALQNLEGVPGRLQPAGRVNGATVVVDYAHTPDALENVLNAIRPHTQNNLHVLFGCGGDRDAGKRPEMGAVAAKLANRVIVTDDNPRSEDATSIRDQIMVTCPNAQNIGDRREAIRVAVQGLGEGDVLVLAGKGHEQGQIVGDQVLPFDDVVEAQKAIGEVAK